MYEDQRRLVLVERFAISLWLALMLVSGVIAVTGFVLSRAAALR